MGRWYAVRKKNGFYAVRSKQINGKRYQIYMHRVILNLSYNDNIEGDHHDCNTLNNQDDNLRLAPEKKNLCNRGKQSNNTSGYKGVTWDKKRCKWQAQIEYKNKHYFLGYFGIKEDAARAYNVKALELHGEFAKLNIIF